MELYTEWVGGPGGVVAIFLAVSAIYLDPGLLVLVGWLPDFLPTGVQTGLIIGGVECQLVALLVGWMAEFCAYRLPDFLRGRLTHWVTEWVTRGWM